ncbi:DUF1015 domain-containing protein [Candidatus Woesearchaeota archaeon]|nr:DUF1015 domain-containing protein [Candidatus Woesearchaeota archaeon]
MVEIKAFQGYRYNPDKVDIQKVISPPYDVISKKIKKKLASAEYNFVHVNLNDSHEDAGRILNQWIDNQVLLKDEKESLYVYQQEFTVNDFKFKRTGFVCLLKIEEWGNDVLPHEQTFDKIVDERYGLMEKTMANFGNLFMIYEDDNKEEDKILTNITNHPENINFVDANNVVHKLWAVDDKNIILDIIHNLKGKKAIMADGHHRYQTSLNFYKNHQDVKGAEYVMVTLVNAYNEGLLILPTNRIINDVEIDIERFSEYFYVKKLDSLDNIGIPEKSFIIAKENKFYFLELKNADVLDEIFGGDNIAYKELDVAILHKLIFEKILKIPEEELQQKIQFIKGNEATVEAAGMGKTAFFVKPPSLKQTIELTKKGKIMPQKSTYFYPKLFSGLVLHKFEVS